MNHSCRPFFYGRRQGKAHTPLQKKRFNTLLPQITFNPTNIPLAWRKKKICLEIGFGGGENLLTRLQQDSQTVFIGVEPFLSGVNKVLAAIEAQPSLQSRVRLWAAPIQTLWPLLPHKFFDLVCMLFPDPWPKKRHHKRRLFNHYTLNHITQILKEGGTFFLASDDAPYIAHMLHILQNTQKLIYQQGIKDMESKTWPTWPEEWPRTRYAEKALNKYKKLGYFIYKKR